MNPHGATAEQYAEFADDAREGSPCFVAWAEGVRDDPEVLAWLDDLPPVKRQPNLVFAAARWHGVPAPGPYAGLRDALLGDDGTIRTTVLERSTQTNEVGRLATLVPAFARLATGPVALLEVGASAGLCLFPDRWSYRWETAGGVVTAGSGPTLRCRATGGFPAAVEVPEVAWRAGVDLHPLDVTDDDATAWLEVLVWPEQDERRERLRTAVAIARADPPRLERGDLLTELPRLVEEGARHAPVVVFHSAVIAYLADDDRRRFAELMTGLVAEERCHWVSNESPRVLPGVAASAGERPAAHPDARHFVLGSDGTAVAWTHGHGAALHWLDQPPS